MCGCRSFNLISTALKMSTTSDRKGLCRRVAGPLPIAGLFQSGGGRVNSEVVKVSRCRRDQTNRRNPQVSRRPGGKKPHLVRGRSSRYAQPPTATNANSANSAEPKSPPIGFCGRSQLRPISRSRRRTGSTHGPAGQGKLHEWMALSRRAEYRPGQGAVLLLWHSVGMEQPGHVNTVLIYDRIFRELIQQTFPSAMKPRSSRFACLSSRTIA